LKWKNQTSRRYREFAKLHYKVKNNVFWRLMRVIPSNISKYAEMRRIVFNRICKYLRSVNKKFDEVNSAVTDFVDDSQSIETVLQHLYGKLQIHSTNAESYHEILNYENYFESFCETSFEEVHESVKTCLNDMISQICGTKTWKRNKVRKCTNICEIQRDWGKNLHGKLTYIVDLLRFDCDISKTDATKLDRNLHEVQEKFTEFEFCKGCYASKTKKCVYGENCEDNLNWINGLACHFSVRRKTAQSYY